MTTYADVVIRLRAHPDKNTYRLEASRRLPGSDTRPHPLELEVVTHLNLDHLGGLAETDPAEYGRTLWKSLFPTEAVRTFFAEARTAAASQAPLDELVPLRLCLQIDPGAHELHQLRWELLRDPQTDKELLTDETILFSRFLSSRDLRPVHPSPLGEIKALVVIANPSDVGKWQAEDDQPLARVDVSGELRRAKESLDPVPITALCCGEGLDCKGRPTLDELFNHLHEKPDILYLVCHGQLNEGVPELLLEDHTGQAKVVSADDVPLPGGGTIPGLVEQLGHLQELPRLVVLASCQSASEGGEWASPDTRALAALGPRLAQEGVPAVVAMQGSVKMKTVEKFMPVFFRELRRDGQIDRAMAAARRAVRGQDDWWMPALFMRLESGLLFDAGGRPHRESGFVPSQQVLLAAFQENFVGRREDITWIEQCLADPDGSKHIVIHAPAGFGKSALMARLVELHPEYLYHFIRAEDQNHTATSLLANLCGQLSARIGTYRSYAGVELGKLEEEYRRLKAQATEGLSDDSQLVIVIDGLDEAERQGYNTPLQPEYFRTASSQLRFILAYRSGSLDLAVQLDIRSYRQRALGGLGTEDVVTLFQRLGRHDLADDDQLRAQVIAVTKGEPFYLRFLVEDLSKEEAPVKVTDDLPRDSQVYIARQVKGILGMKLFTLIPEEVRELFRREAVATAKRILQVLAMAQDWLTRAQLLRILGDVDRDLVDCLIDVLRRYYVTDRPDDPSDVLNERYLITPLKLKEAIQNVFTSGELLAAEERLLTFCREWSRAENAPYAFNYLTHHLISLGRYDELLDTLDQPFFQAKAAALGGAHTVLIDIQRGLHECLARDDHLKIVRMLLLLARTKQFAEQRASAGGIVIDANKRLYAIALASARAIDEVEMRFRQLLLIAEAAALNDDRDLLVEALDEALGLEIDPYQFPDKAVRALLHRMIVQYRATDRALALAQKVDSHPNQILRNWCLEESCVALIETDASYAMELHDRVDTGYAWFALCQRLARRVIESQPNVARKLLDPAERRADAAGDSSQLLRIAATLRQIDPQAAEQMVRSILANLAQQDSAEVRELGELMNHATMELAHLNLTDALRIALTECPHIVDSIHTRYRSLAYILRIANESGVQFTTHQLDQIFDAVQPQNRPEYPEKCDEVLHGLALQFAGHSDWQSASAAFDLIEDSTARAKTFFALARTQRALDVAGVVHALSAVNTRYVPADLLEGFKSLYKSDESFALQILSVVADYPLPMMHFLLANSILEVREQLDKGLVEKCLSTIASMELEQQVSSLRRLATTVVRFDVASARQILQQAVDTIHQLPQGRDWQWREIAEMADEVGFGDVASSAIRFAVKELQQQSGVREGDFEDLALFVLQREVVAPDDIIRTLLGRIDDSYIAGKLVSALSDGETYVNSQLEMSRLELGSSIYTALSLGALKAKAVTSARRCLDLFTRAHDRAFLLIEIAELEYDAGDVYSAKGDLAEAWGILETIQIPTDAPRRTAQRLEDELDNVRFEAIEVWSRLDPTAAVELSDCLSPWHRHRALALSASQMNNDLDAALETFQRAREAVRTVDAGMNRHRALCNLYWYSVELLPEFAEDCLAEALLVVDEIDEPHDRAIAYLDLIARKDRLPEQRTDQLWNGFVRRYLVRVDKWGRDSKDAIIEAVERLTDREDLRNACLYVAGSLRASHEPYDDNSEEIARLALRLSRVDLREEAEALMEICDGLWSAMDEGHQCFEGRAYQVCAKRWLDFDEVEDDLKSLLFTMRQEVLEDGSWAFSVPNALDIIACEYDGVTDDKESWDMLVELCDHLGLRERAEALLSLVDGALDKQDFEKVIPLVARLPIPAYQTEAVTRACDTLLPHIVPELDSGQKSTWRRVFDVASYNVNSLLRCSMAWCYALLDMQASTEAVDSMVAAILSECAFVQKS